MVPSILRFHSQASHQQNFCSRSIWAGSANIYKIAKTSGEQHRHNLCKCRHSPHLLTGLQPQSREALVCEIQGPSGDKETIKIFTSGLQLIILVVFLFIKNNNPCIVPSLCPLTRAGQASPLSQNALNVINWSIRVWRGYFSKTVFILVTKLVPGVV